MNLTLPEKERIQALIEEGVARSADRLGKLSRTQWGVMSSSTNEIRVVRLLSWFHSVRWPNSPPMKRSFFPGCAHM